MKKTRMTLVSVGLDESTLGRVDAVQDFMLRKKLLRLNRVQVLRWLITKGLEAVEKEEMGDVKTKNR